MSPEPGLRVDLFWSVRSPYCYVLGPRMVELARRTGLGVSLRPVHPAALRSPERFAAMRGNPLARPYFLLDTAREAAFQGLAFRRPQPDPVDQDPETLEIAPEQPLAIRLGHLCVAAEARGRGLGFAVSLAELLWSGAVDGWDRGDHLARVAERAGLELGQLEADVAADPQAHEARLAENDRAVRAAGHWGVPVIVFRGEPFFGQDRYDQLVWRLRAAGLEGP